MLIPKRYIKPKEVEVKPVKALITPIHKDNSGVIIAEIKRIMAKDQKPTKWVFDMLRNESGDLTQVIANAIDTGTII
jgi:hypothetical protein